ncbi:hypothetical protein LWI29_025857 [Acer saccharum]|uniref:Uncharacterized protein n=1 Tax=Acer saccharum TaxID=4024 RepID=A0AA39W586_ACESA|nr:hypothetical protein LWI29_025857 [Acer saccharum]
MKTLHHFFIESILHPIYYWLIFLLPLDVCSLILYIVDSVISRLKMADNMTVNGTEVMSASTTKMLKYFKMILTQYPSLWPIAYSKKKHCKLKRFLHNLFSIILLGVKRIQKFQWWVTDSQQDTREATSCCSHAVHLFPVGRISKFLKAGKYTAGDPVNHAAVHEYLAAEILELDVVQVEDGVGSESTTSSSSSRYATITEDGAVCWQKEIEIQRRKKEMLEKKVQFVLSLKKIKTLETKEEIIERNIRFVRQFQKNI